MIDATKTMERARRKLGAPIIDVELTDEQMTSLLKDAQDTFFLYATISDMSITKREQIEDVWIKKYFYALCKETLGRIRGKYVDGMPIPGGVNIKLDFESLLQESIREKCFLKYMIFGDKELLKHTNTKEAVFVFYINTGNFEYEDIDNYIRNFSEKFRKPGFINYFIPVQQQETRVECIYPVSTELDEDGKNVINRLNEYLDELTKDKNDEQM